MSKSLTPEIINPWSRPGVLFALRGAKRVKEEKEDIRKI
jgi:hypothetical protein